jgi:hypothetical protein
MPTPLDLDAIAARNRERRRVKEATPPAPWRWGDYAADFGTMEQTRDALESVPEGTPLDEFIVRTRDFESTLILQSIDYGVTDEVAEFLAHARNDDVEADVDSLLAEVRRLREENEGLRVGRDAMEKAARLNADEAAAWFEKAMGNRGDG